MKRIGLTGNLGCGKSTVARMFKDLGAIVVDADEIIRGFYRKGSDIFDKLVDLLGKDVLDKEGNIDRKKVADKVFRDEKLLRKLEEITHGEFYNVLKNIESRCARDDIVIVEASLIYEKGTEDNYDKVVVVYSPLETCRERALRRGITLEDFERRIKFQIDIEEKRRRADYVIDNSGDIENTRKQVKKLYKILKSDP